MAPSSICSRLGEHQKKMSSVMRKLLDAAQTGNVAVLRTWWERELSEFDRAGTSQEPALRHLLFSACIRSQIDVVSYLLSLGSAAQKAANGRNDRGQVPLHVVCGADGDGNASIVEMLAKNAPKSCYVLEPGSGLAPIHLAAKCGYLKAVKVLFALTKSSDVKSAAKAKRRSAVHMAAASGQIDVVRYLVENTDTIDALDDNLQSALFSAANFRRNDVVAYLIGAGADYSLRDRNGLTALHRAAGGRSEALVAAFFSSLNDNDSNDDVSEALTTVTTSSASSLSSSSSSSSMSMGTRRSARIRAKNGETLSSSSAALSIAMDVARQPKRLSEVRDSMLRTPLFSAVKYGKTTIACNLVRRYGADVNATDTNGETVLHVAMEAGAHKMVKELLALGANVNALNSSKRSPVHDVASNGDIDLLRSFAEHGADLGAVDGARGGNVLHFAARSKNIECVEFIVERLPELASTRDHYGQKPLDWAPKSSPVRSLLNSLAASTMTTSSSLKRAREEREQQQHDQDDDDDDDDEEAPSVKRQRTNVEKGKEEKENVVDDNDDESTLPYQVQNVDDDVDVAKQLLESSTLSHADMELLKNWTIEPSEIDIGDRVAGGAFGAVHRAQWHGQTVAVKKIYAKGNHQEMFLKESLLLARLRHPHIVQYLGCSLLVDSNYIVMEWLPQSLSQLVRGNGGVGLALNLLLRIARGMASGLSYLHAKGIVHRDVKVCFNDVGWCFRCSTRRRTTNTRFSSSKAWQRVARCQFVASHRRLWCLSRGRSHSRNDHDWHRCIFGARDDHWLQVWPPRRCLRLGRDALGNDFRRARQQGICNCARLERRRHADSNRHWRRATRHSTIGATGHACAIARTLVLMLASKRRRATAVCQYHEPARPLARSARQHIVAVAIRFKDVVVIVIVLFIVIVNIIGIENIG
jgi:ankyrin repeat protein